MTTTQPPPHPTAEAARVAEIEAREKHASDGPWEVWDGCSWRRIGRVGHQTDRPILEPYVCKDNWPDITGPNRERDLDFVVNARTDIPWLTSHLRTAWAERDAAREELARINSKVNYLDKWKAEREAVPAGWTEEGIARALFIHDHVADVGYNFAEYNALSADDKDLEEYKAKARSFVESVHDTTFIMGMNYIRQIDGFRAELDRVRKAAIEECLCVLEKKLTTYGKQILQGAIDEIRALTEKAPNNG